jgi:F-type H+-transporting ATPase subunit delta
MPEAVSYRYARALADAVLDPRSGMTAEKAKSELRAFDDLVSSSSELQNALLSPAVAPPRKRAVIARFASELPLQKIIRNFLYVLVNRRRIGLLHDIRAAFEAEIDERSGVVRAQVTSAGALAEAERAQVQATLSQLTGKQVRIDFATDSELIGGVVAKIGSTIYDGSVRGQLDQLREKLSSR